MLMAIDKIQSLLAGVQLCLTHNVLSLALELIIGLIQEKITTDSPWGRSNTMTLFADLMSAVIILLAFIHRGILRGLWSTH
ncbi:hypothetical protein BS642_20950 [Chromobacterium violaceum]|nr:hypothetical protein BS642_20950 [Chromobacterium violaceum]